jgi:protein associated with RNAse G/E
LDKVHGSASARLEQQHSQRQQQRQWEEQKVQQRQQQQVVSWARTTLVTGSQRRPQRISAHQGSPGL